MGRSKGESSAAFNEFGAIPEEFGTILTVEQVFTDASGKWRSKSALGHHYYSLFMCAKRGTTIYLPYAKRKQLTKQFVPLVYLNHHHDAKLCLGPYRRSRHQCRDDLTR
jgi:hypothetical protein